MTDQEQNMVNRVKITIAQLVLDFDDELLLDIIKKSIERREEE